MRVITGTKVIIANETLTIRRIKISNNPQGYKGVSGGIKKKNPGTPDLISCGTDVWCNRFQQCIVSYTDDV